MSNRHRRHRDDDDRDNNEGMRHQQKGPEDELVEQVQWLQQRLQQVEHLRSQLRQRRRQDEQLRRGTYYASIDQVFAIHHKPYNQRHRDAVKRESIPLYQSRHVAADEFQITREGAMNSENLVLNDPSRARPSHSGTQVKAEVWPNTILGEHRTSDSIVVIFARSY